MKITRMTAEADEADIYEPCDEGDGADEDDGAQLGDFAVGGKPYNVEFNKGRIKLYERAMKRPLVSTFSQNGGAMSIDELQTLLAYGLRIAGGPYVPPGDGMDMAGKLIEANGYFPVYGVAMEALGRDCGFLFKGMEAY